MTNKDYTPEEIAEYLDWPQSHHAANGIIRQLQRQLATAQSDLAERDAEIERLKRMSQQNFSENSSASSPGHKT